MDISRHCSTCPAMCGWLQCGRGQWSYLWSPPQGPRAQPMESSQLAATSWRGRHQTTENSRDNTKDNSRDNSLEYDLLPAPRAAAVPDPGSAGRALHQPQGGVLAGPVHHPAPALCGKEAE